MMNKIILPVIFLILGWGFWVSPDFKVIAAGVAIFLFGMLSLETGFKVFTGGTLEKILQKTTDKRWKSLTFGIVSTSIMQSSSLVSVITISFLSAGLIGLYQGIGIIFGANLGTTTGAWLVAGFGLKVNIASYAMPMLVFGTLLIFQSSKSFKGIGYILVGLGFLFLGIHYMKEGFEAFKQTIDLTQYSVSGYSGLLLYLLIGTLATVIMQSSHATLVLTITALAAMQISYENALALAIGANIGTTITAIIGSLGSNEDGKRLALAHLIFNFSTGLVAILFISQLLLVVDQVSIRLGIADNDYSLKLAVFHTIFNLLGVVLMLPLMQWLVMLSQRLIPARTPSRTEPRYLHQSTISYAGTATAAVHNEILHLWDNTIDIMAHGIHLPREDILNVKQPLPEIVKRYPVEENFDFDRFYELKIKSLYSAIIGFISRTSFGWELEQSGEIHWLRKACQEMIDAIKDVKHLQKNLIRYTHGHHAVIKAQYNDLRLLLAKLIRDLETIHHAESVDIPSMMIDQLKLERDTRYTEQNRAIDEMIRERKITADMATSLMNDQSYVYNISRNLIEMGQTLFVSQNKELSDVEKSVQLDDSELKSLHDQHQSEQ